MKKLIVFSLCMFLFSVTNAQSKFIGDEIGVPAIANQLGSESNQTAYLSAKRARWCEIYDPWKDKCVKWWKDVKPSEQEQKQELEGRSKAMNRFVKLVASGKTKMPVSWAKQAQSKFPGKTLTAANNRFDFITKRMESIEDDE